MKLDSNVKLTEKLCFLIKKDNGFNEATKFVKEISKEFGDSIVKSISIMASDPEDGIGLLIYTFYCSLLIENPNNVLWHEIARDILSNNLCHYSHAYEASLYHAKKVCDLEPYNVKSLEIYLDIGKNRTKKLTDDEAGLIAKRILDIDPKNLKGSQYIKYYKNV